MSPRAWRVSSDAWWVGTRRPRAGPAACRSSAPLQTLAVHAAASEILPIHPVIAGHQEHVQAAGGRRGCARAGPVCPCCSGRGTSRGSFGAVLPITGRRVVPHAHPLTSSWVNEHLARGHGAAAGVGALPVPAVPVQAEDGNNDSED